MIPKRIAGATRWLGAPKGWEPERDGDCSHLAILDIETGVTVKPSLDNGRPTAWMIMPTAFGKAVRAAAIT